MKKLMASMAAAALLSAGVVAVAAGTANAAGCGTYANTPSKSGNTASGKGGRVNCGASVSWVKVKLVHTQPGDIFNEVKAETQANNVVNVDRTVSWTRPNTATAVGWDWRTEATSSSGQQTYSSKKVLW